MPDKKTGSDTAIPNLIINTQYIKDMSFENPGAPQSLLKASEPPKVDINVDVQAYRVSKDADVYEVTLTLNINAHTSKKPSFVCELLYAGVFSLINVKPEQLEPVLLIECPRLLFPFARSIVASATRDGGFAPLLLHPIDFAGLYLSRRQQGAGVVTDKIDSVEGSGDADSLARAKKKKAS